MEDFDKDYKRLQELVGKMENHTGSLQEFISLQKEVDELAARCLNALKELNTESPATEDDPAKKQSFPPPASAG